LVPSQLDNIATKRYVLYEGNPDLMHLVPSIMLWAGPLL